VTEELNNGEDWVLPNMLEPNGEVVDDTNGCDEVLFPNRDGEEPNAGELKAGAEVPNPEENVEVFGANGLLELGVVLEKGLADDMQVVKEKRHLSGL
jgi:hypothetical protein